MMLRIDLWWFLLGACAVLSACTSNPTDPSTDVDFTGSSLELPARVAPLYQEVGATHDTAMILMAPLERTQIRLRRSLDYVGEPEKKMALQLLTQLKKAEEDMMDWMHNFKSTELYEEAYEAMSEEEMLTYLRAENESMKAIDAAMRGAILEGRTFLERYEERKAQE